MVKTEINIADMLKNKMEKIESLSHDQPIYEKCGRVVHVSGLVIEVSGISLPIGQACRIILNNTDSVNAEVIGFTDERILIMPFDNTAGVANGMLVIQTNSNSSAPVSQALLGRVINSIGEPIDDKGEIGIGEYYPLFPKPLNPLKRDRISESLDVGVRAINSMVTICRGQRMGIFASSGMGKSVLLGMMTKFSSADVVVVGLIGERGREVKEFIEEILGKEGLMKSVIVAVPADSPPLMKATGAAYATSIAEYFRDQNKHVLLIIDSLTRYAQAQREISLSGGEMPATKGFTPSVFAKLSQLVERSGNGVNQTSSITAIYTILLEGEEINDPVAEHIRSLIDGHIILSKDLAESGHYPAIDIERSISRVMHSVVAKEQYLAASILKQIVNAYYKNRDMINIGMYQTGSDRNVDVALKLWPDIQKFLTQEMDSNSNMTDSVESLYGIVEKIRTCL